MTDSVAMPVLENGFGGAGMGAGFIGGLVLGSIWNGGGFGWGGKSQLQQQTLYLVDQLKPAATAAAGA